MLNLSEFFYERKTSWRGVYVAKSGSAVDKIMPAFVPRTLYTENNFMTSAFYNDIIIRKNIIFDERLLILKFHGLDYLE